MSRLSDLEDGLKGTGFYVRTYSPGGGPTRYRFFSEAEDKRQGWDSCDYFGPGNGSFTALGIAEAEAVARGIYMGRNVE